MATEWQQRSDERMPDGMWNATVSRVRGEFDEMPCLRVTPDSARALFGLTETSTEWILKHPADEGFLMRSADGQYVRRSPTP